MACTMVNGHTPREQYLFLPLIHVVRLQPEKLMQLNERMLEINDWFASDEAHGMAEQIWPHGFSRYTEIRFTDADTAFAFKMRFG